MKYRTLGTFFDRVFRNDLNNNFSDIDNDIKFVESKSKQRNDAIQSQINTLVVEGDSSVEAAQARVKADGTVKTTLKERLDESDAQLAHGAQQIEGISQSLEFEPNAKEPLIIDTFDGSGQTTHPKVLFFLNGWNGYNYWMAHTPYPFSNQSLENPQISVSRNGTYWEDFPDAPTHLDEPTAEELGRSGHFSDTDLVFVNGILECWYRYNESNQYEVIYRRTTANGKDWTPREVMLTMPTGDRCYSPSLIFENNKYKMWYVNKSGRIVYIESTNGTNWSTPVECQYTFKENGNNFAWHLEVIKTDLGYELLLNAYKGGIPFDQTRKFLCHSASLDGINFGALDTIMRPTPSNTARFDNKQLYRSSMIKVNGFYRMWYSAESMSGRWRVGLAEGSNIKKLKGVHPQTLDSSSDLSNVNNVRPRKNYVLRKGQRIEMNSGAYVKEDAIRLVIEGLASALLKVSEKPNTLEIKEGSTNAFGNLDLNSVMLNFIRALDGSSLNIRDTTTIDWRGTNNPYFKLVHTGVGGAGFRVGTTADTLRIMRDNGTQSGLLDIAGLLFTAGANVPNVEGAIRYNSSTKKHQGYNGTTWIDLY